MTYSLNHVLLIFKVTLSYYVAIQMLFGIWWWDRRTYLY